MPDQRESTSVLVAKPDPILLRPLKIEFRELIKSSAKLLIHASTQQWAEASADVVDAIGTVDLRTKPGQIAWTLLWRSMTAAIAELCGEAANKYGQLIEEKAANDFSNAIEEELNWSGLTVDVSFFEKPGASDFVTRMSKRLQTRLEAYGPKPADAATIAGRLRAYFAFALVREWRKRITLYEQLESKVKTPFDTAAGREGTWLAYSHWLQREFNRPVFDENFGLEQIFIPLRAYWVEKTESESHESQIGPNRQSGTRHVQWLDDLLQHWLDAADRTDDLRILSGGPGSGKSSAARRFAAMQSKNNSTFRTVFVPLHHYNYKGDIKTSLDSYCADHELLPESLADENRLLIIFDGLDELAKTGPTGAEAAHQFVQEIRHELSRRNQISLKLQVLITGRPVAVQQAEHHYHNPGQLIHLLPYYMPEHEQGNYLDPLKLLTEEDNDQRDQWWVRYSEATGKDYKRMPEGLRDRGRHLDEVTAQPLLNYLVALSHERDEVDFAGDVNLNEIYADLLKAVHERKYEDHKHKPVEHIEFGDFERLLETIALAAWHGNGRTTTVGEIEEYCKQSGMSRLLTQLQEDAKSGVTRLLTAFYFQQNERRDESGDKTFEFTHKSFGEYLAARRIVRELTKLTRDLERRENDSDDGIDTRDALERWARVCGPTRMDHDISRFLRQEVALKAQNEVKKWQQRVVQLIDSQLKHGMPMEKLIKLAPTFREMNRQSINSEEALLVTHSACGAVTKFVSPINWPEPISAGEWVGRISGQRESAKNTVGFKCLDYIVFDRQTLHFADAYSANFARSSMKIDAYSVQMLCSDMLEANLRGANLVQANLQEANLQRANLQLANLLGANLSGANLEGANLSEANLEGANLKGANLKGANLEGANLSEANLEGANLKGANLDPGQRLMLHKKGFDA